MLVTIDNVLADKNRDILTEKLGVTIDEGRDYGPDGQWRRVEFYAWLEEKNVNRQLGLLLFRNNLLYNTKGFCTEPAGFAGYLTYATLMLVTDGVLLSQEEYNRCVCDALFERQEDIRMKRLKRLCLPSSKRSMKKKRIFGKNLDALVRWHLTHLINNKLQEKNMTLQNYCLGLAFTKDKSKVLLIKKLSPPWQEGRLNGVGGKVEQGEDSAVAMNRECREETGLGLPWEKAGTIHGTNNDGSSFWCEVFFAFSDKIHNAEQREAEQPGVFDVATLGKYPLVNNLRWIIPYATSGDGASGFLVEY